MEQQGGSKEPREKLQGKTKAQGDRGGRKERREECGMGRKRKYTENSKLRGLILTLGAFHPRKSYYVTKILKLYYSKIFKRF